jgi:hypothetical protein
MPGIPIIPGIRQEPTEKAMHSSLHPHPDCARHAAIHIEVEALRPRADRLTLLYKVAGNLRDVIMPPILQPERAEGLWRHTCFEAFVRPESGDEYLELNFAPSTQWAAYRFGRYRTAMSTAMEIDPPPIEVQSGPDCCTLKTSVELAGLPALSRTASWRVGLSAVIEDKNGSLSYWALAHPPGKPDFHHADSFSHELVVSPS